VPVDDLHDTCAAEAFKRFGRRVGFSLLRRIQGVPYVTSHLRREFLEIRPTRPHPDDWLRITFYYIFIRMFIYTVKSCEGPYTAIGGKKGKIRNDFKEKTASLFRRGGRA